MRILMSAIIGAMFLLTGATSSVAQAQFTHLTERIPTDANTIILIDSEKLHASPLAQKEGWAERHEKAFQSGLIMAPPNANRMVTAARVNHDTMESEWEVSLMDLKFEPSMSDVALRYRGTTDRIANRDVAVLPGDVYAVSFGAKIAAVGFPARRQDVARWINKVYSDGTGTSGFLRSVQDYSDKGTPIIMAMDLAHVISPTVVKQRLQAFDSIKTEKFDVDVVANTIASIQGISLGIVVTDRRYGAIKVDFSENVAPLKDLGKRILLEALENRGAVVSEFYGWDFTMGENYLQLSGVLKQSGMRRILSLLSMPPSLQNIPAPPNPKSEEYERQAIALATKNYFQSVVSLIDDLREQKEGRKTMGQLSVWFGKYARTIDQMPILHVDNDALNYGKFVSDALRGGQSSVTEASAQSRIRQNDAPQQYDVYSYSAPVGVVYGQVYGWEGWRAAPNEQARAQDQAHIRTQERIRGSLSANTTLQHIDESTAATRRLLTEKYNQEF